jgi:hypothetical protein
VIKEWMEFRLTKVWVKSEVSVKIEELRGKEKAYLI